jgi:hypothetical protein
MTPSQHQHSMSDRSKPTPSIPRAEDAESKQRVSKKDVEDALKYWEVMRTKLEHASTGFRKDYDEIDASLNHYDLHPGAPWGFVVFRTSYGVDTDESWARMLEKLRSSISLILSHAKQDELIAHHELTIIEDEKTLADADSHTVRHAFRAWVADDLTPRFRNPERYGGSSQIREKLLSNDAHDMNHPVSCLPPRWNFCLFVDDACLRSLDTSFETVKILTTNWQQPRVATVAEGWEDGETDHEHEEVGWMYMDASAFVDMYNILDNAFYWSEWYERPASGYI